MKIVFGSSNKNKIQELKTKLFGEDIEILSLEDINFYEEIPETSDTIKGNSIQKSKFINRKFNIDCFADDTGLEVEALNDEPGVFTARYGGENSTSEDNMKKLLSNMKNIENRKAKFITVISLILNNKIYTFEGIIEGEISEKKIGKKGFGYDPIFIPKGYKETFAQMTIEQKNKISHRALAVNKLINFLKTSK